MCLRTAQADGSKQNERLEKVEGEKGRELGTARRQRAFVLNHSLPLPVRGLCMPVRCPVACIAIQWGDSVSHPTVTMSDCLTCLDHWNRSRSDKHAPI